MHGLAILQEWYVFQDKTGKDAAVDHIVPGHLTLGHFGQCHPDPYPLRQQVRSEL